MRQPHVAEVLVDVVAWADLPALDVRTVRNDPVPPQGEKLMRLFVESPLLELAHDPTLVGGVGGAVYLVEQLVHPTIPVIGLVVAGSVVGNELGDVEQRVHDRLADVVDGYIERTASERVEIGASWLHPLRHIETNGAPLVDQPSPDDLIGLIDAAVVKLECKSRRYERCLFICALLSRVALFLRPVSRRALPATRCRGLG